MIRVKLYTPSQQCCFGIVFGLYVFFASTENVSLGSVVRNATHKIQQQLFESNGTEQTSFSSNVSGTESLSQSNKEAFPESTTYTSESTTTSKNKWIDQEDSNALIDEIDILGQFMTLQLKACPYVDFCTIKNTQKHLFIQRDQNVECCHYCSCEEYCIYNGNCCPDYLLFKQLNVTYLNIESLKRSLRYETDINVIQQYVTGTKQNFGRNGVEEDCVKTQLKPINKLSPLAKDYILITRCSKNHPSDITRTKCEDHSSSINLTDHIPVYSKQSFKSYGNIHCMACNEPSQTESLNWETIIYCASYFYIVMPHFERALDVVKFFLNNNIPKCNIVFEPPSNYSVKQCTFVNTATCGSKTENHTDSQWSTLKRMCENFVFPFDKEFRAIDTFKNIACLYCNENSDIDETCVDYYRTYPKYLMHISPTFIATSDHQSGRTLNQVYHQTGNCSTGYILDIHGFKVYEDQRMTSLTQTNFSAGNSLNVAGYECANAQRREFMFCRKVHCPRGMFASGGICLPTFTAYTDIVYKYIFKLEVLPGRFGLHSIPKSNITRGIIEVSKNVIDGMSIGQFSSYAIFHLPGNRFYLLYVILDFQTRRESFYNSFSTIVQLNELLSNGIVFTGIYKLGISTDIFSDVYIREIADFVLYDFKNNQILQKDVIRAKVFNKTVMPITRANICYRIKLDINNVTLNDYLQVRESSNKIPLEDIDFDSSDGNPIACIEHTGLIPSNENTVLNKVILSNNKQLNTETQDIVTGVYPIVSIAGFVLFVIVVRTALHFHLYKIKGMCVSE